MSESSRATFSRHALGSLAISGDLAEVVHRSRAPGLRHGDRVLMLVNIPSNKSGMVDAAILLCVTLGAGRLNPRRVAYRLTGYPQAEQS